jgi:hypothetical protein
VAEAGKSGEETKRYAPPLSVAKAVFWSFVGIRKKADYEKDALTINPVHVIIAGIMGAALFVGLLLMIVKFLVLAK